MFFAAIIKALLLTQVPVLAKPTGTGQDGAQVATVANNILTRQLLVLDENPQPDGDADLIRLKSGMQAHVPPSALGEDEIGSRDNTAFPSGPARNDLGPRIFLSVPTEPEGYYGKSDSAL